MRTAKVSNRDLRITHYLSDVDPFPLMCALTISTDDGSDDTAHFPAGDALTKAEKKALTSALLKQRDFGLTLAGYREA